MPMPNFWMRNPQLAAQRNAMMEAMPNGRTVGKNMMQNGSQIASWFGQQSPAIQQQLLLSGQMGNGPVSTPWGMVGIGGKGVVNPGMFTQALINGGMNQNALNQDINYNSYNAANPGMGANTKGIWDFTQGGSGYGQSSYDGSGWDSAQPGITQKTQFDPNAYQGGTGKYAFSGVGNPNVPSNGQQQPPFGSGGFGPPPPNSGGAQNAVNQLQQGVGGSWNPYSKVYTGPVGAAGDALAGINADGTPVNSGRFPTNPAQPNNLTPQMGQRAGPNYFGGSLYNSSGQMRGMHMGG